MQFINRLFNLRPGDFSRGLPLFGYSFLIISSYVMAQVARDALFLNRFTPQQLPYVDITTAVVVSVIVAFYIRLDRRAGLRNLLAGCLHSQRDRVVVGCALLQISVDVPCSLCLGRYLRRFGARTGVDLGQLRLDNQGSQKTLRSPW